MPSKKPEYHLERVEQGQPSEPLTIYSLHQLPRDLQLERRGFFGLGTTLAGAVASLAAAGPAPAQEGRSGRPNVVFAHTQGVLSLAYAPDGEHLVSSSRDETAKVWNLKSGTKVAEMLEHDGPVFDLAIAPNGAQV